MRSRSAFSALNYEMDEVSGPTPSPTRGGIRVLCLAIVRGKELLLAKAQLRPRARKISGESVARVGTRSVAQADVLINVLETSTLNTRLGFPVVSTEVLGARGTVVGRSVADAHTDVVGSCHSACLRAVFRLLGHKCAFRHCVLCFVFKVRHIFVQIAILCWPKTRARAPSSRHPWTKKTSCTTVRGRAGSADRLRRGRHTASLESPMGPLQPRQHMQCPCGFAQPARLGKLRASQFTAKRAGASKLGHRVCDIF
jgi:hypothetical protein